MCRKCDFSDTFKISECIMVLCTFLPRKVVIDKNVVNNYSILDKIDKSRCFTVVKKEMLYRYYKL